jgi:hypothetical protein
VPRVRNTFAVSEGSTTGRLREVVATAAAAAGSGPPLATVLQGLIAALRRWRRRGGARGRPVGRIMAGKEMMTLTPPPTSTSPGSTTPAPPR